MFQHSKSQSPAIHLTYQQMFIPTKIILIHSSLPCPNIQQASHQHFISHLSMSIQTEWFRLDLPGFIPKSAYIIGVRIHLRSETFESLGSTSRFICKLGDR